MNENIIIAGSGGQGVLTLGLFLAQAGLKEGKKVTWLPSYGAEKRGGFSFCSVVISDEEIFSPLVAYPDTLLLFDQRAAEAYKNSVTEKTFVIENTSLIKNDVVLTGRKTLIPATDIATSMDFVKAANIVMAGAYFGATGKFLQTTGEQVMGEMLKGRNSHAFEKNLKAFSEGMKFIKNPALVAGVAFIKNLRLLKKKK
ncbi:MAG: 2-oxoacid:acceptor oxidoreductase family protein [bacterium]